jgi:GT2 family glycosyltransferase
MKKKTVNVVIPSIEISKDLIKCLSELNKLKYKNFFVTIVLDKKNNHKLRNYNFKLNKIFIKKKSFKKRANMSRKRNLAVKKYKSDFIAFLDSDAYPNKKWIEKAIKILLKKKMDVTGGPSLPFPNQSVGQKIAYYCKRSYFITGYQNFRKFKAKARLCDWLESCNIIMRRNFYLKLKGMNEKKYIGEDKDFFDRARNKNKDLKVFYDPSLYIYHRDRGFLGYLLQRLCFGISFLSLKKTNIGFKGYQPLLPFLASLLIVIFLFLDLEIIFKFLFISLIFFSAILLIFLEIKQYVKNFKYKIYTIIGIILGNMFFSLGGFVYFLGIKNLVVDYIYILSRKK